MKRPWGVFVVTVAFLLFSGCRREAPLHAPEQLAHEMHQMELVVNHGMLMVLEGFDSIVMARSVQGGDDVLLSGESRMKKGKEIIDGVLRGQMVEALREAGAGSGVRLERILSYGEALTVYARTLFEALEAGKVPPDLVSLMRINELLMMAMEGNNFLLISYSSHLSPLKNRFHDHGWEMLTKARQNWPELRLLLENGRIDVPLSSLDVAFRFLGSPKWKEEE